MRRPLTHRHAHRRAVQRMASLPVHAVDQLHSLVAMLHRFGCRDGSPHRIIPPLLLVSQAVTALLSIFILLRKTAGYTFGRNNIKTQK